MRLRTLLLVLAIVLLAAFAALNVDEFTRVSVLSLGFTTIQVPLGLVMLLLLVVAVVVFLASTLYMQSTNLLETRRYARELNTQRELADRAEASRFTELRNYLEVQAIAAQQRNQPQAPYWQSALRNNSRPCWTASSSQTTPCQRIWASWKTAWSGVRAITTTAVQTTASTPPWFDAITLWGKPGLS
ncbi:hypothetical protein LP415_14840 [Polaromonas sp. P1(28)-8]|nr:hypothetical protein LP415_14840 [Polaromonas sp. P1(28)-8]